MKATTKLKLQIWGATSAMIAIVALIGWMNVHAKLELCRTYYSEMSTLSCFISEHLPGVPRK